MYKNAIDKKNKIKHDNKCDKTMTTDTLCYDNSDILTINLQNNAKNANNNFELYQHDNTSYTHYISNKKQHDNLSILTNTYKQMQKMQDYNCDVCNFCTSNKYNYSLHNKTKKHINTINGKNNENYKCECGKIYKHKQSLYTHKKKCKNIINSTSIIVTELPKKEESTSNDIIEQSMKLQNAMVEQYMKMQTNFLEQNTKLQNVLTELIPKMDMIKYNEQNLTNNINNTKNINNINNNTLNNNINQNFNINLFLNENFKDAISIGDFVKNIKV